MNVQVIPKWMLWLVLILHPIIYSQKIKIKTFPQSIKSLIFFSDVVCSLCVCMCLHEWVRTCMQVCFPLRLSAQCHPPQQCCSRSPHAPCISRPWLKLAFHAPRLLCTSWRWILMKSNLTKCHTYFSMGENLFVGDEGNMILAASRTPALTCLSSLFI